MLVDDRCDSRAYWLWECWIKAFTFQGVTLEELAQNFKGFTIEWLLGEIDDSQVSRLLKFYQFHSTIILLAR